MKNNNASQPVSTANPHAKGNLYVIAAPSGTGKTTLVDALIESVPGLTVSISHTTRARRTVEEHGIHYYFISQAEFQKMIQQNEFFEYAKVFNNLYGTSKRWVEETLNNGIDVILEIDWQGAQQIQKIFKDCISIFILPPAFQALYDRLKARNQDPLDTIKNRLIDVKEATSHIHEFDYVVMNDDFKTALEDLKHIILAGRLTTPKQSKKYHHLINDLMQASEKAIVKE